MSKQRPLWLRWKLPYLAVAGIGFMLVSVLGRPATEAKMPPVVPPKAEYAASIVGIGVVEPKSEIINIGVELPGVVREVPVHVGDRVAKGDILFVLDQRDADAQIAILQKSLTVAEVQAKDAASQFAIVSGLSEAGAVAKDEFNRRRYKRAEATAHFEEVKAQLAQTRTTKERLTMRAPIDAEILDIDIRPGEYASAGALANPLIRIGDVSRLHVRVEIDEENATRIRPESKAEGVRRGDTKTRIPLTFVRFEPYVRPKQNLAVLGQRVDTRVVQAIYAMPEGSRAAFVGQQMDVFIDQPVGTAP